MPCRIVDSGAYLVEQVVNSRMMAYLNARSGTPLLFLLFVFVASCGGSGGGGETDGSGFVVPGEIVSARFAECLQAQAKINGWRENSDVRKIECQRAGGGDYGIGIETLEGIQVFTNLEEIIIYGAGTLSNGRVGDLSPLRNLTRLRAIEMYDSDVRSVDALRGVSSLERLVFIPTLISNVSPISDLPNLRQLTLSLTSTHGPPIEDFSPLSKLATLEELHLAAQTHLKADGLGFLAGMTSLKVLDISENFLTDLEGLQYVPFLESLDLSYSFAFTFGFGDTDRNREILSGLTNLKSFWYESFDGRDIGFLENMRSLEFLAITGLDSLDDSASALTTIGNLSNLKELYIGGRAVGDLSRLQGLSDLAVLWVADANVDSTTLAFPGTLANLRVLSLLDAFTFQYDFGDSRGDFKNTYAVFKDLPALTELHLERPWLRDAPAVALNGDIQTLSLVGASLSDVTFLLNMPKLQTLDLSGNPFTEMAFLAELPNLQQLTINDTSIDCDELASFMAAAPGVEVATDLHCP